MKGWIVSLFLFFCCLQAFSQQEYFIYIQTTNSQAFYVKLNNKILSSTASGYLIIPKLPDSVCTILVGFPGNAFPEQEFSIPLNRRDAGFTLSNFGEKGWGLMNIQTLSVLMNSSSRQEKKSPELTGNRTNNAFALLLSNAVNDSTVLYTVSRPKPMPPPTPVVKEEEKKDTPVVAKVDTVKKVITGKKTTLPKKLVVIPSAVAKNNANRKSALPVAKPSAASRDSIALVKREHLRDSIAIAKNNLHIRDSIAAQRKLAIRDSIAIAKNNKRINDSIAIRMRLAKRDSIALAKNNSLKAKNAVNPAGKKSYTNAELDSIIKRNIAKADSMLQARKKPVVKDSNVVTKNHTVKNPEPDIVSKPAVTHTDSIAKTHITPATDTAIVKRPIEEIKRTRPLVIKAAEILTDTSYIAVFIDESHEKFDTVRISVPFKEIYLVKKEEKPIQKEPVATDANMLKNTKDTTATFDVPHKIPDTIIKTETKKDSVMPMVKTEAKKDSAQTIAKSEAKKDSFVLPIKIDSTVQPAKPKLEMINSDCKALAWDSDIDKLRIKMLLVKTADEKILLAKKLFALKCLTVKQVRALSELFSTEEEKYKWCDAVYSHVSDSSNFPSLSDLFKDNYYLNRFKAMLRN